MTEVFEFILIFLALLIGAVCLLFVFRRVRLAFKVSAIRKLDGVRLKLASPLSLFSLGVSRRPLLHLYVKDSVYDVHLFNGGGRSRFVHIASEKYAVVYSKFGGITPRKASKTFSARPRTVVVMPSGIARAKTRIIPTPKRADGHIPVLLFCPEPSELTYVTPERTSIRVAFTGERVGDWLIFTAGTLFRHVDRSSRDFFDGISVYETKNDI